MIRYTAPRRWYFPRHILTDRYCTGEGIELGASAHNTFDLPGSINVAPFSDDPAHPDYAEFQLYLKAQEELSGTYALVDVAAEAHDVPVANHSVDYVVSSHVVEHIPNLIAAFVEWTRIVRSGGHVVMIFPTREAHPGDVGRPVTPRNHFIVDFLNDATVDDPGEHDVAVVRRGHYHVFTRASMIELVDYCNERLFLGWELVASEEIDTKVGNGHTVLYRLGA